ncbi:MAG: PAS domain S-box protein [Novosphingobium sp.]|nr:PAS domain S-box protein [Novosphingobium sp.]
MAGEGMEVSSARSRGGTAITHVTAPDEFRLIADSAPVPMWLTGLDRVRRFVNRAYVDFLGLSYEEARAFDWRTILHPDDHDRIVAQSIAGEASLKPFTLEARYRRGDGEWRWMHSVSQPSFDAEGAHNGFIGVVFDLTEAREAERHLRETEERLRLATESAGIGTWEWDLPRLTGNWSAQAQRILGMDRGDDVPLAERMEAIVAEDREGVLAHIGERVREGGDLDMEYRVQRPDGEIRWVASRGIVLRNAEGRMVRALGTVRDITERRRAQERLEELNRTLESAVAERTRERNAMWRLSRDLLLVLDTRLRIVSINPIVAELTGYSADEVTGRPFTRFLHPNDQVALAEAIHRGRRERISEVEARVITRDGELRQFVWSASPEGGQAYVSGRDVTEERDRLRELLDAQEALRQAQKLEAIGQLTGGVAHDFNNLLSPIIGGLDILRRRGVGGEREQRLIDGALQSAERAKVLVQRLLAFARRQPLQVRAIELAPLLDGLRGLLASTLGPRVELRIETEPGLAAVMADSNQLEMAILNLAVNARDAMPQGGRLAVEARNATSEEGARFVELSVGDDGVGMDDETLARAIEPFFSNKGVGKGTGLGLSMVEGLTAQLGGSLRIASRPGEGTTVTLALPAAAVRPAARAEPGAAPPESSARGRILLVDDEPLVRLGTAETLREEGFEVDEADDGDAAIALAAGNAYACVITDYLMPGLNGVELARRLREQWPGLPILLLSGYADPEAFSELPYLTKPCFAADLLQAIAGLSATLPVRDDCGASASST